MSNASQSRSRTDTSRCVLDHRIRRSLWGTRCMLKRQYALGSRIGVQHPHFGLEASLGVPGVTASYQFSPLKSNVTGMK